MTRQILVGGIPIGGGAPVVIQSMLNTKTTDVEGSLAQIRALKTAGCQIATVRFLRPRKSIFRSPSSSIVVIVNWVTTLSSFFESGT